MIDSSSLLFYLYTNISKTTSSILELFFHFATTERVLYTDMKSLFATCFVFRGRFIGQTHVCPLYELEEHSIEVHNSRRP